MSLLYSVQSTSAVMNFSHLFLLSKTKGLKSPMPSSVLGHTETKFQQLYTLLRLGSTYLTVLRAALTVRRHRRPDIAIQEGHTTGNEDELFSSRPVVDIQHHLLAFICIKLLQGTRSGTLSVVPEN